MFGTTTCEWEICSWEGGHKDHVFFTGHVEGIFLSVSYTDLRSHGLPPGLTPIYSECDIGIVNSSWQKISIFIVSSCFNSECSVWRTNWCPNRSVSNKSVDHTMARHSFLLLLSNWYLNKFAILLDQMTENHTQCVFWSVGLKTRLQAWVKMLEHVGKTNIFFLCCIACACSGPQSCLLLASFLSKFVSGWEISARFGQNCR